MKSNESTCLGTSDDKPCRNIITNDIRFCSNCGLKNSQYVSEEKPFTKIDGLKESSQRKDVKEQSEEISTTASRSGMGKSTFINLVRDVNHGDPGFADVGFGDCTSSQTEYKHPRNEHISFVDFPGFGTDTFTKKMFSDRYDLCVFDFCLVFIESVIMEDDVWIVKKLKAHGIPYCFIRSKIDVNISMAEHMGKKENEVVNEIRKILQTKISKHDVLSGSRIFLVSNIQTFSKSAISKNYSHLLQRILIEKKANHFCSSYQSYHQI
ncbi:unnamed protein product [Mytilus edulis]|uniref:IRG-type G domain-containing protein n=1 Tax=Mytilus edulis TaxID=6550 RepID=A0A8S3RAA9_MYTED|nr:unnamed protein product [Mytilus edulis]